MELEGHPELRSYLERVAASLGPRSLDALDEIRSHLHARIDALRRDGEDLDRAVRRALEAMGDPARLGAELRSLRMPSVGVFEGVVRRGLALIVAAFALFVIFDARGWDWGPRLGGLVVASLVMPLAWALWPTVVWRRNRLVLVGLGVGVVALLSMLVGASSSSVIETHELAGGDAVPDAPDDLAMSSERWPLYGVVFALVTVWVAGTTLALMSRAQQRLVGLATILLPVIAVEAAYLWEERLFDREARATIALLDDHHREHGEYPSSEVLRDAWQARFGPVARRLEYRSGPEDGAYMLWSARVLSPGCGVVYHSERGWTGHD